MIEVKITVPLESITTIFPHSIRNNVDTDHFAHTFTPRSLKHTSSCLVVMVTNNLIDRYESFNLIKQHLTIIMELGNLLLYSFAKLLNPQ